MDFTFTDISSSFSAMVQQNLPKDVKRDTDNASSQNLQFGEKLSKILKKIESSEEKSSFLTNLGSGKNDSEKILDFLSGKLDQKKGAGFIAALQNIFLILSNQDLKNASIDADGLEALKTMLLKAGFKESDIDDLIEELLENQGDDTISLDELFDKLFDLTFENQLLEEDESENYIEISAIPFLESLLNSLNIPKDKIQEILTTADRGEKGLDLDFIINKLQELQKESFYTGKQYQTEESDNNFSLLLKQMGLENNDISQLLKQMGLEKNDISQLLEQRGLGKNDISQLLEQMNLGKNDYQTSSLTLADLLTSLENLRAKMSQQQNSAMETNSDEQKITGIEKPLDILNALFKGLKFTNQESKLRTRVFEFSEGQIKNQFKNQLVVTDDENANKKGLFSFNQTSRHKSETIIKLGLKEMEALLGEKKSSVIETKNQMLDNKEFFKQLKAEGEKAADKNSILTFDTRANDTQSNLNILKTKSTFKNLPNYVTQQVSKSLVRAINQGENTLRIQLKPPELGRLMITIDNSGSNIKINIMTENHAARDILTSNVNELRTVLSNSGVNLERFDVDMNSNFRQSMADARNQTGNFNKQNKNREKLLSDSVNAENINESTGLLGALDQKGSVHLVA
jgi:flagellar hook-length control protein FliK